MVERRVFVDFKGKVFLFLFQTSGLGSPLGLQGEESTRDEQDMLCVVCWETVDPLQCNCTTEATANVHRNALRCKYIPALICYKKKQQKQKKNRKCCLYRTFIGNLVLVFVCLIFF